VSLTEARPSTTADEARFRSELRGTLAILALMVTIVGVGWLAAVAVGRERVNLAPGVSILQPRGERVPTGRVARYRWQIGSAQLTVVPKVAGPQLTAELDDYRAEAFDASGQPISLQAPDRVEHSAGDAVRQRWEISVGDGRVAGELIVVVHAPLAVIFDARWPSDEDPAALAEIQSVIDSLRIEPLGP
jgi:hypothetical protein